MSPTGSPTGNNGGDREFSTNLLNLGDVKIPDVDDKICLTASLCQIVPSLEKMIENVYGHIESIHSN